MLESFGTGWHGWLGKVSKGLGVAMPWLLSYKWRGTNEAGKGTYSTTHCARLQKDNSSCNLWTIRVVQSH